MSARATRQRVNRRDRRKAKASEWERAGTVNPSRVGHHPGGGRGEGRVRAERVGDGLKPERVEPLRVTIAEILEAKGRDF
jgi:hypothetical protein